MRKSALMMAALAAAAMVPGIGIATITAPERDVPRIRLASTGNSDRGSSSPNGGRRGTVAQDRRAATKRRNRLRAKGQHRSAVR